MTKGHDSVKRVLLVCIENSNRSQKNKQRNARGDRPIAVRRCFNPMSHAGTHAQQSGLLVAF